MKKCNSQDIIRKIIFFSLATACLVYPLLFTGLGIDLTDSGYAVSQGMVALEIPENAVTGTWLSNLLGGLWGFLFGYSLFSFRLYGSVLIILSAIIMYCGLRELIPRVWLVGSLLVAEVMLRRLITVGSYNQVFMLGMAMCTVFLVRGLAEKNRTYLILGGFILALSIFARIPSVIFIIPYGGALIAEALISRKGVRDFLLKCAHTIIGLILGLLLCFATMAMSGVLDDYLAKAIEIFNTGNSNSSSHGFLNMIDLIIKNHKQAFGYSMMTIGGLAAGGYVLSKIFRHPAVFRYARLLKGLMVLFVVVIPLWSKPLSLKNYDLLTIVFLQVSSILLLVCGLFYTSLKTELRILSILSTLTILFIPFGTNNGYRYAVNASFIFLPTLISVLQQTIKLVPESAYPINISEKGKWTGSLVPLFLLLSWSIWHFSIFGLTYVYRDSPHERLSAVTNIPALRFQKTTPERSTELNRVYTTVQELPVPPKALIAYGAIPLLHVILNMPPMLSNPWPDLESYDIKKIEEGLAYAERENIFPLIIIAKTNTRRSTWPLKAEVVDRSQDFKYQMLLSFISSNHYSLVDSGVHFDIFSR